MSNIEPHSPHWFRVVQNVSPMFAQSVRFTIQCEKSPHVCSICGNRPVGDYRVVKAVLTPPGVPSIRLCECCVTILNGVGETLGLMDTGVIDAAGGRAEPVRTWLAALWKRICLLRP